jgi:hypothetical protein
MLELEQEREHFQKMKAMAVTISEEEARRWRYEISQEV